MSNKKLMDRMHADLLGADDAEVEKALTWVLSKGDQRSIRPMLYALVQTESDEVKQRITAMLYQIKVPGATEHLIEALEEDGLRKVRGVILASLWNAGLDVQDHLDVIITCAVEGNANECLDCVTIVENQEIWPETAVVTNLRRARNAEKAEIDPYRKALLHGLVEVLEERIGITD